MSRMGWHVTYGLARHVRAGTSRMGWHVTFGLARHVRAGTSFHCQSESSVLGSGIPCKEHLDPCAALQRPAALREIRSSLKEKLGVGSIIAES